MLLFLEFIRANAYVRGDAMHVIGDAAVLPTLHLLHDTVTVL
jgi:hypothetical protein